MRTRASEPGVALHSRTSAAWADAVLAQPLALLQDHAHCELGAAASAQGLIHRRTSDAELCERLAALAAEELAHFRRVLRLVREFGGELTQRPSNPYAEGLARAARSTGGGEFSFLDRLLVSALIEARSHERFELLAERARDRRLAELFAELGPSERGHMALFPELARRRFGDDAVERRLDELAAAEAEVLASSAFAPRVHSGEPMPTESTR
ncbi:MAG: tRNA isopentenyl-2-thiomethyl-A-37 hydroxylase MiaE [Planctomycetota bacterium]